MATITTGDFHGRPLTLSTDEDAGGGLSPRHGFSDAAQELIRQLLEAGTRALAPATKHENVTPSDSTVYTGTKALFVGTAGNVVVSLGGIDATYRCLDGQLLVVAAEKIKASTTASNIVRMFD